MVRYFDRITPPGEIFSADQIKDTLGVSRAQVSVLIESGKLIAFNVGTRRSNAWRVRRCVLLRYMADNSNVTPEMLEEPQF